MVHIEGTRSFECRTPVQKMSGAFIDMAMKVNAPIVPVRFVGGLPADPLEKRTEFPVGMGTQDIWFGRPLLPAELVAALNVAAELQALWAHSWTAALDALPQLCAHLIVRYRMRSHHMR